MIYGFVNFVAPWFAEPGVLAIPADDEIYTATLVAGELPDVPPDAS